MAVQISLYYSAAFIFNFFIIKWNWSFNVMLPNIFFFGVKNTANYTKIYFHNFHLSEAQKLTNVHRYVNSFEMVYSLVKFTHFTVMYLWSRCKTKLGFFIIISFKVPKVAHSEASLTKHLSEQLLWVNTAMKMLKTCTKIVTICLFVYFSVQIFKVLQQSHLEKFQSEVLSMNSQSRKQYLGISTKLILLINIEMSSFILTHSQYKQDKFHAQHRQASNFLQTSRLDTKSGIPTTPLLLLFLTFYASCYWKHWNLFDLEK